MMSICICGGGSLGHVCAGVFASQGYTVNILSGHPEKWDKNITVTDQTGKTYKAHPAIVSSSPEKVISCSDIVLLCVPGYLIEKSLSQIKPFLKKDAIVGSIVSSTGFFFKAHDILSPDTTIFGFQRVPFIARINEYGKSASLLGYKPSVNVAIENAPDPEQLRRRLEDMFITPVILLHNFYEASLTNSNPILHTGRLYSMWGNSPLKPIDNPILFYADWTDDASKILIDMDNEFMKLVTALNIRKGIIPSLLEYYESVDAPSLTNKIRSIEAFKMIKAPMIQTEYGWIPDFNSRYFTEDFPYGLSIIKNLCVEHKLNTPTIDKVYNWGIFQITDIN